MAKCAHCDTSFSSLNLENVSIKAKKGRSWVGVAYCCPYCGVAVSVAIDPIALKSDTVGEVLRGLERG